MATGSTRFFGRVLLPEAVTTVQIKPGSKLVLASAALAFNDSSDAIEEDDDGFDGAQMMTVQVRSGRDQDGSPWLNICTLSASMELQWPLTGLVFDGDEDGTVSLRAVGFDKAVVHITGHIALDGGIGAAARKGKLVIRPAPMHNLFVPLAGWLGLVRFDSIRSGPGDEWRIAMKISRERGKSLRICPG
jgi:hypothetical protein